MHVDLYTSAMIGGWHPDDLENFLGGNEEADVRLSEEFVKAGATVRVYTTLRGCDEAERNGVHYFQRGAFQPKDDRDILIATKEVPPGDCVGRKIYWCVDVIPAPQAAQWADDFVALGHYHFNRISEWLRHPSTRLIPYGIDEKPTDTEKDDNLAIYTTSPYRGLDTLLTDWELIKQHRPNLKLQVTYKWDGNPDSSWSAQHKLLHLMLEQEGVSCKQLTQEEMTELYARATYWVHPLNNPDGDLIGFSAMKAKVHGCQIIIPGPIGGFQDAVDTYTPYEYWKQGNDGDVSNALQTVFPDSWENIVREKWMPLLTSQQWNVGFAQ